VREQQIFSVNKQLLETIWPFCIIVTLLLVLGIASMDTLSAVRAFVSGESFWSKSQKESVHLLNLYAKTHQETHYQQFLNEISIPLNDKIARIELQKSRPNIHKATQALIKGRNSPDDVKGMANLFLAFQNTSLLKPAIQHWTAADVLIQEMVQIAARIHQKIQSGQADDAELQSLLDQVNVINEELTPLSNAFSNSIGEASLKAQRIIVIAMVLITVFLMVLGIIFTRRVIVRQVTSAMALKESEERWKFALEGESHGVWDLDISTQALLISQQWNNTLGYGEAPLQTTFDQWKALVYPGDADMVNQALTSCLQGETPKFSVEYRLQCKDGSYKWILTHGMVVSYGEEGKPLRMVGTHSDIDEQKQAEAALRESDENQRALLEAMVDGVFVAQDYRFVFVNPFLPKMLGYTEEEFIDMPFEQVVAPGSIALWTARFTARVAEGPEPIKNYPVEFLMKGGQSTIWLDLHASRVVFRGKTSVLGILRDVSKQKEAEDMVWHQANFDSLTGLPNRRMFRDRLGLEIKKAERARKTLAVMFLDLDHFKVVNDTMGHDVGDKLLQEAARRLKECVRDSDTVARLGGDEFVLLITDIKDRQSLERISRNILEKLSAPFQISTDPVYVSASIGITLFPVDAHDFEDLLKNADQAMYAAKGQGRNRFSYFTPSMQAAVQHKMRVANDLRHALEREEFKLVYQPIVEVASGEIRKAEALLRWQHPTNGMVNPAEFIPVAEETGIIVELGEWVFKEALGQLLKWRDYLHPDFQISVNKSPVQFRNSHSDWVQYMKDLGLPGRSLVVEITESLLLDATDNVDHKLLEFRDAGINVAIDDFGTGYSSLSYLKKFDIDFIKIDQSFIKSMTHSHSDMGLCEAIILMAHKLAMKVIAEGVETEAQYQLLAKAHCDYVQGYLISKPLTPEDFEALVRSEQAASKHIRAELN
jgi:diguanylate cyclase (GGDEF)-like protein/PAS domain S-box-containing protein